MGTIATLLGLLVVTTPVPVAVCDLAGCRVQAANTFALGCRVQTSLVIAANGPVRARWTLTSWRLDGLLASVTVTRSFGSTTLWGGEQAYWEGEWLSATTGPGWLSVHATDRQGCVTDTRVELVAP